jgi:4-hydroxybenzoate polyprenyltransferase
MMRKFLAVVNSCHPIPCLAVSLFAGMFAYGSGLPIERYLWIFTAVLFHQFSVGFSNDWLDSEKDKAANRTDKPTVSGLVDPSLLRTLSLTSVVVALALTIGLGVWASVVMLLMLVAGWSYNLGMKSNWSSVIPYAIGFGLIPIFVSTAASEPYVLPTWTIVVAALLGVSAHFANVLPDIVADKLTGVNALPHILGQRVSALVIAGSALLATVIVVNQSKNLAPGLAIAGLALVVPLVLLASILSLRQKPPRVVFPLLMLTALVNVVLLMFGAAL